MLVKLVHRYAVRTNFRFYSIPSFTSITDNIDRYSSKSASKTKPSRTPFSAEPKISISKSRERFLERENLFGRLSERTKHMSNCLQNGSYKEVLQVLDECPLEERSGPIYSLALHACRHLKLIDRTKAILAEIYKTNKEFDPITCCALISAFCTYPNLEVDIALEIYQIFKKTVQKNAKLNIALHPNEYRDTYQRKSLFTRNYLSILFALNRTERFLDTIKFFEQEIVSQDVSHCNVIVLTNVCKAYLELQHFLDIDILLDFMKKNNIKPDAEFFHQIIYYLTTKYSMIEASISAYYQMKTEWQITPIRESLVGILYTMMLHHKDQELIAFFKEELKDPKIVKDAYMFTIVLSTCIGAKNWQQGKEFIEKMTELNIKPSSKTLNKIEIIRRELEKEEQLLHR